MIFRGTITEITEDTIVFEVTRVWKGKVAREFRMPYFLETTACIGFWPFLVQTGNDLLVFADWLPPGSPNGAYFTSICTLTQLAKDAEHTLEALGPGRRPQQNRGR